MHTPGHKSGGRSRKTSLRSDRGGAAEDAVASSPDSWPFYAYRRLGAATGMHGL